MVEERKKKQNNMQSIDRAIYNQSTKRNQSNNMQQKPNLRARLTIQKRNRTKISSYISRRRKIRTTK